MQNDRRTFIKFAIGGVIAGGAGYAMLKMFTPFEKTIAAVIFKNLEGLNVNKEGVEKFAALAAKENPWGIEGKAQKLLGLYSSVNVDSIPVPFKEQYKNYSDQIVEKFLLSSSFFINKMDESKEITFLGKIWSPYNMPCMNPFSSLYYPNV